jgi:hypothetical protein
VIFEIILKIFLIYSKNWGDFRIHLLNPINRCKDKRHRDGDATFLFSSLNIAVGKYVCNIVR